jgi:hypothetical protein
MYTTILCLSGDKELQKDFNLESDIEIGLQKKHRQCHTINRRGVRWWATKRQINGKSSVVAQANNEDGLDQ